MLNLDPFTWWIITISWSIAFLILVGIYLYVGSRAKRDQNNRTKRRLVNLGSDFVFVMVLLGLLVFYIISVNRGSSLLFAAGNVIVEAMLIVYLWKNRSQETKVKSQLDEKRS